jgi:biopolymer transport protein ExbD
MAPVIAVDEHGVQLNGSPEADADELSQENTVDWKLAKLHDDLVTLKNNHKLLHPSEGWSGTVLVRADRELDFRLLKKILYSCQVAGYPQVQLLVQKKS